MYTAIICVHYTEYSINVYRMTILSKNTHYFGIYWSFWKYFTYLVIYWAIIFFERWPNILRSISVHTHWYLDEYIVYELKFWWSEFGVVDRH